MTDHRVELTARRAPLLSAGADDATRLRVIVDTALDAVVTMDESGLVTGWNPSAEAMFGWRAEEVMGRRLSETIVPERYRERHETGLRTCLATGEGLLLDTVVEVEALRRDGTELPVDLAISPAWRTERGTTFIAFIRDISRRRRAERLRTLRFSVTETLATAPTLEDAAPRVLSAIGEGLGWEVGHLWLLDERDAALHWKGTWTAAGSSSHEFENTTRGRAFGPGVGLPGRVLEEGMPVSVEDVREDPSLPLQGPASLEGLRGAVAFPILLGEDVTGVLEFAVGTVRSPDADELRVMEDVGRQIGQFVEHRLAEENLRRRLNEVDLLLRAARRLGATLDTDEIIAETLRAAADAVAHAEAGRRATMLRVDGPVLTFIQSVDEMSGPDLDGRQFPIADNPFLAEALLTHRAVTGPYSECAPALQEVVAALGLRFGAWAPLIVDGEVVMVLSVASRGDRGFDLDEISLLEGIASVSGLALGNAQRFALARDHAARMEALERAKTRFLNLATHDLRTPLTVMSGYLALLSDGAFGALEGDLGDVVNTLAEQADRMNNLVGDMLETARLDDERLALQTEEADLRELVARGVEGARPFAGERHSITLATPEQPVRVMVDVNRTDAIITNLLTNAIKYSPEGGPVEVAVQAAGTAAVVRVKDRGMGIPADQMDRLFTRFGRIVRAETAGIPGTGLGLYLARELARLHGGDISVESAPGKGSVFSLRLPLLAPA